MIVTEEVTSLAELQDVAARYSRYGHEWAAVVYKLINVIKTHDEKWKELDDLLEGINEGSLDSWYYRTLMTLGRAEQSVVEESRDATTGRNVR